MFQVPVSTDIEWGRQLSFTVNWKGNDGTIEKYHHASFGIGAEKWHEYSVKAGVRVTE
jgi:hypothetical protein